VKKIDNLSLAKRGRAQTSGRDSCSPREGRLCPRTRIGNRSTGPQRDRPGTSGASVHYENMRGDFFHNHCLIEPIASAFTRMGGDIHREFPVRPGRYSRYADLVINLDGSLIVVEGESVTGRVMNDIAKAEALRAGLLLLVTPHRKAATAIQRKLRRISLPAGLRIWVMPLGSALQRLANKRRFISALNRGPSFNPTSHSTSKPTNSYGKAH